MDMQPLFRDAISVVDGTSKELFKKGLCLPSGSLSNDDIDMICNIIREFIGE
jgi:UDP-N-acetylbacillosamine transaminase